MALGFYRLVRHAGWSSFHLIQHIHELEFYIFIFQLVVAIETGSHFQNVMTAKRDDWLTDSSIGGESSSLYLYALTHFESIVAEAAEVWLEKVGVLY